MTLGNTHPAEGKVDFMPDNTPPIVVGVDGSLVAIHAALWSAAVASRPHAPLHILTATTYLGHNPSDATAAIRAAAIVEHRELADQILKAAEDAVRRELGADCRLESDFLLSSALPRAGNVE
jgi:hypothetical protein